MKNICYRNCLFVFLFLLFANVHAEEATKNVVVDSAYLIGPGDVLSVSVWKEEGMQLEVVVRPDGGFTYPLIGEIQAGGLTANALSIKLVDKLKRYIPQPNVTVSVLRPVSNKIFVLGKVNRPGEFAATGYVDVLQALTMAGGLTPYADSDDIKIIRRTATGNKMKLFDYDDVISGDRLDMNIILQAGDTVVVP